MDHFCRTGTYDNFIRKATMVDIPVDKGLDVVKDVAKHAVLLHLQGDCFGERLNPLKDRKKTN